MDLFWILLILAIVTATAQAAYTKFMAANIHPVWWTLLVFITGLTIGILAANRYTFHAYQGVLYRANRITGAVSVSDGGRAWRPITNAETFTFEEAAHGKN